MRPKKNRFFCPACGRSKIIFPTKEEADRFISFNRSEIFREKQKAPIRSYYCTMCCAFHVTSNPSLDAGEQMDTKDANRLEQIINHQSKKQLRELKLNLNQDARNQANIISAHFYNTIGEKVLASLVTLHIDEALNLLENLLLEAEDEAENNAIWASRLPSFKKRVKQFYLIIDLFNTPEHNRKKTTAPF